MASLNDIANISIELRTASISKSSFGIPLIVSPTPAFSERVRKYTSYSSAVADNLDAKTLAALSAVFSQSPQPAIAYVGRRDIETINLNLKNTVSGGKSYSISVSGKDYSYTAKASDTAADVMQGIADALQADSDIKNIFSAVTVTDGTLLLTPVSGTVSNITDSDDISAGFTGKSNLAADLEKIKTDDNTWYGWSLTETDDDLVLAGAAWTETQQKLFFARAGDTFQADTTATLKQKQYLRTVLIADRYAEDQYIDAAVMGRFFTKDPGATVFALKNLPSMKVSKYSDTEKANLIKNNVNTYEQYSADTYLFGVGTTLQASGRVVSGEFIDVVRDRDWLIDDIQKSIASILIRNNKIPYTNAGIALLANALRARLQNAQTQGVIAPDSLNTNNETVQGFTISYPNAADVDADIKATRILYLSFTALLAGAIQLVKINGTLSYSNEG
jgi:hypothetical protein